MRTVNKIRIFKPGEFLNNCFSAREFGLCLVADLQNAFFCFPPKKIYVFTNDELALEEFEIEREFYDPKDIEAWFDEWFSEFIEKDEDEND